jgi:hypothetical protein
MVENHATADKRSVISDDSGNYSFPFLQPARYELKIQAKGFTCAIFQNISVGLGETPTHRSAVAKVQFLRLAPKGHLQTQSCSVAGLKTYARFAIGSDEVLLGALKKRASC